MEDRYLRPYRSVHRTGVFCFIQKKKDHWKKIPNFRWFGKFRSFQSDILCILFEIIPTNQ